MPSGPDRPLNRDAGRSVALGERTPTLGAYPGWRLVRIDETGDGDARPRGADAPWPAEPGTGSPEPREGSPPQADAAVRAQRAIDYQARVDAAYRAHAIDQGCARVEQVERETVTPAMRRIEAEDGGRHLAGLEHRLKERYRIEEKVDHDVAKRGVTAVDAFAAMKDAIRYTFCYPEERVHRGRVHRLRAAGGRPGFQLWIARNSWPTTSTKGSTAGGASPTMASCSRFSFTPQASLDAKEETHAAYERLRTLPDRSTPRSRDLHAYQREVTAKVPVPAWCPGRSDYPRRRDASRRSRTTPSSTTYSSREAPAGVLATHRARRRASATRQFGSDLAWTRSALATPTSAATATAEFYEITEDEANRIVERIRRSVTGER